MRRFRFGLFLGALTAALGAAGYLWAPLVSPSSPALHLSAPVLQSTVLPVRIMAVDLPSLRPGRLLPLRVTGSFVLRGVSLHVAPAAAAQTTLKPPATPVVERPVLRPSNPPAAMPAPTALPEPVVRPATPTPGVPIPLPLAPQPVVPATPPAPNPVPSVPQPVVPATPPAPNPVTTPIQPVVPVTPPAPSPVPASTPVSEPPPPPTPTPPPPTPAPPPATQPQAHPGWGCGDRNHNHTGPPGQVDAASPC